MAHWGVTTQEHISGDGGYVTHSFSWHTGNGIGAVVDFKERHGDHTLTIRHVEGVTVKFGKTGPGFADHYEVEEGDDDGEV